MDIRDVKTPMSVNSTVFVNKAGKDLIKLCESLHDGDLSKIGLQPKRCPVGIWTIGWGHALRSPDGKRALDLPSDKAEAYRQAGTITEEDADKLLDADLSIFEKQIKKLIKVQLNDNQFSAVTSLAYNTGIGNFKTSTVLNRLNSKLFGQASEAFKLWNKGYTEKGLVVLKGLVNRRAAEVKLFNTK